MKASIIILNWNGGAEDCLEAVGSAYAQTYPDKEIVFVDNGSEDGSDQAVLQAYPDLIFVQTGANLGCPGGRNVGAQHASGDIIFFLENDGAWNSIYVVASVMEKFERHPDLGALYTRVEGYSTGTIDPPLDPRQSASLADGLYLSSSFRGGASALRADLFRKVGMFPGDFFRQYEERFVSLLIYDEGYFVAYFPGPSLRHKGSDYAGKSSSVVAYNCMNQLKTIRRIYPALVWPLVFITQLTMWSYRLFRRGQIRNTVDIFMAQRSNSNSKELGSRRIAIETLRKVSRIRYSNPIVVGRT